MGLHGDAENELMQFFRPSKHDTIGSFVIGLLIAFAFATGLSATMQRTFERIWRLPHADWRSAWRHFVWAVMTSALFAFGLWINKATHRWEISGASEVAVESTGSGLTAFACFWWTQRILLRGRVHRRQLLPGAVLIGLGTTVLLAAVQIIAPGQTTEEVADYGLVGAAFILSVILVAFSTIVWWGVFLGREISRWANLRRGGDLTTVQPPVGSIEPGSVDATRPV